ncbi:hypothetical protein DIPPA_14569 [Diplonema papillatum]|nr:hypothetical protein DIPPA_14569 [Diplonema papillatum]
MRSSFAARGARDTIEVDRHPATHNASPPRPDDLVYAEGDRYQNNYKPGYNDSKQPYQYNRPAGGPSSYSYNNNDNYPSKRQPRSTPHAAIGNELAQTQSELLHVLRESAYNANNRAPRAPYQETKPYPAIDAPRYQPMQHYPPSGDEAYLNQRVTEPVWHGQRYPPITRWVVQDDQDTRRDKMWAPPGMNNFANLEALPLASAPEGAGGPAALQPEDLERARDVIRELFALHGLTGPKYEGLMEPWLRDANVIESIARLCTAWVPMTRYGLREGSPPIEQWFTIVSFVNNKGGGRFPCLTWFDDPDSKKYRDHCPLNELVSFKAGTTYRQFYGTRE